MLSVVMGLMGVSASIFSSTFLLLAFLSKKNRKVFVIFSIFFGFSSWSLFEYAIYLTGSDLFYLLSYPALPLLPYFFFSIGALLFLIYLLLKKKWA